MKSSVVALFPLNLVSVKVMHHHCISLKLRMAQRPLNCEKKIKRAKLCFVTIPSPSFHRPFDVRPVLLPIVSQASMVHVN